MTSILSKPKITDFDPEDQVAWDNGNSDIARRNLVWSVVCEHIGFSVWSLFSVLALFMPTAKYGINVDDKFVIAAVATLVGSCLRIPYTQATAKFGGRNWAVFSAVVLMIPAIMAMYLVMNPPPKDQAFGWFLLVAALTGFGGANFASSMTNINAFYPQRLKGWALGLNAGGGNIGVPVVQLMGLLVISVWFGHPEIVCAIYIVALAIAGAGAAIFMDNLDHQTSTSRAMVDCFKYRDTWVICLLYIGTFGSFIGFSFAFGQVLQRSYITSHTTAGMTAVAVAALPAAAGLFAAKIAWIGPLLGSVARPYGGKLADKRSGGLITMWSFVVMAVLGVIIAAAGLIADDNGHIMTGATLTTFIVGFVLLFLTSGIANGSVYKIIPAIFERKSRALADKSDIERAHWSRSMSGALIGIAGAAGGLGGVGINLVLRQSYISGQSATVAFTVFVAFYIVAGVVTWLYYVRRPAQARGSDVDDPTAPTSVVSA